MQTNALPLHSTNVLSRQWSARMNEDRPNSVFELDSTAESSLNDPKISFVIPALNEERFIADTVEQFSCLRSTLSFEVIVADGGSTDKTIAIAAEHGARTVVDHGLRRTIASGRNLGAELAKGELIVFCDADTRLEDVELFTQRILKLFQDERIVGAVPRLEVFPTEREWRDRLFSGFVNRFFHSSFLIGWPYSGGQCQVVRKASFRSVEGYDGERVHGEDCHLIQKLSRVGRLRFLSDLAVFESPRRYRKLGYIKLIAIGVFSVIGQSLFKRNVLKSWSRID